MGFLTAVLGLLVAGYIVGFATALTVFREPQGTYEDGGLEQLSKPALSPNPAFARIMGRTR